MMEVKIDGRVVRRPIAYISADRMAFDRRAVPVLHPGETLKWVFGSTIPVIVQDGSKA